jgi:hypothetical protein
MEFSLSMAGLLIFPSGMRKKRLVMRRMEVEMEMVFLPYPCWGKLCYGGRPGHT